MNKAFNNFFYSICYFVDLIAIKSFVEIVMRMFFVSTQRPVDPWRLENKINCPKHSTQLIFKKRFVLCIEIMNFYGKYPAGYISIAQFDVSSKLIFFEPFC